MCLPEIQTVTVILTSIPTKNILCANNHQKYTDHFECQNANNVEKGRNRWRTRGRSHKMKPEDEENEKMERARTQDKEKAQRRKKREQEEHDG